MKSRLQRGFFRLTIQTPGAILLIVGVTAVSLWLITYYSYVDLYLETTGEFYFGNPKEDTVYLKVLVSTDYLHQIKYGQRVIYYFDPEGERFEAQVTDVNETDEGAFVKMETDFEEFQRAHSNSDNLALHLEIFLKKERVIYKYLQKSQVKANE